MRGFERSPVSVSLPVISLAFCLFAATAIAGLAESTQAPSAGDSPAGLRAYVDPETGELTSTPSPAQVEHLNRALELSMRWSGEDLEPFELRRGGKGVFLDGRFQSALVVRWSEEGAHEYRCVEKQDEPPEPVSGASEWPEK